MPATKVALIGATGYNGFDLIRILLRHKGAEITYLGSRTEGGKKISEIHTALAGLCDLTIDPLDMGAVAKRADVAFLGVPHTAAMEYAPELLKKGVRVIDLSADYRLKDPALYAKWYKHEHTDQANLASAAYGMPELFADRIRAARLVANPGCYPTSVILPAYPLIKDGLVEPDFISDSKSGVSGAGKKVSLEYIFVEVNEAVLPYKVGRHQHSPEMDQALSDATGRKVKVTFVPHLIPMDRGIVSTMYFRPARKLTPEDIEASYRKHYSTEPFVRLRGNGAFMRSKDVTGTNFIDIAWTLTDDYVIVTGVLDNLVKGAAGQAVECMNLMFGHDRTEGLLFA